MPRLRLKEESFAPCVIIPYAPSDERTAPPAAMMAIACVQVAAAGLGLGATFTGSINPAAQSYPPLIALLGLLEGHLPYGTLVLGYPAEQCHRIPTRSARLKHLIQNLRIAWKFPRWRWASDLRHHPLVLPAPLMLASFPARASS